MGRAVSRFRLLLATTLAISMMIPAAFAQGAENVKLQVGKELDGAETSSNIVRPKAVTAAPSSDVDVVIDESSFPDPVFRKWILNSSHLNGIGADGVLTRSEREQVKSIEAKNMGIASIKGIELFPNLIMLNVEGNRLTQADLSGNPHLKNIYLRNNQITSIDFSHNTELEFIEIFDNKLSDVDVSMLPKLKFVHLDYNNLKVIDISHNTMLEDDGFVGNNNPLEKVILPKIAGQSFDTFVISELNTYKGYSSTLPEWYTTPDFQEGTGFVPSIKSEREYQPFDGQTLYVKRTPNTYTIRFDANGGKGTMDAVSRAWDDGEKALPRSTFTRTGYRFMGWSATRNANTPTYSDGQAVANIAGAKETGDSITLYALWEPNTELSGYFRAQLSSTQRSMYDSVVSQLDKLTDPLNPGVVRVSVPNGEEQSLEKILFAVFRDHPECFWVDASKLSWKASGERQYQLDLKYRNTPYFVQGFDKQNLGSYRSRFDDAVSRIVKDAPIDPVQAIRYFNAWLANNNVYNPQGLGASGFSRTAASALLSANDSGTAPVCYGYASAMKVLLDRAGIQNAYIEGWAWNGSVASGQQHAWNYVQIGTSWYAVDPTWNDPALASASPLETYLLVGSDTVTTPALTGRERFAQNHDSSQSPAVRLGFSYPVIATNACPEVANGPFELIGSSGTTRYGTLSVALVAARAGDTIRLWSDAKGLLPLTVSRDISIDMNGHEISCSSNVAIRVVKGSSLHLTNSARSKSLVISLSSSAVENAGTLSIAPGIAVSSQTGTTHAISGNEPVWDPHTFVRTAANGMSVESFAVKEPLSPSSGTADISSVGETVKDLTGYINAKGKPKLEVHIDHIDGTQETIPHDELPSHVWTFEHGVGNAQPSDMLRCGTYSFKTVLFGYRLHYTILVTDAVLDRIIDEGMAQASGQVEHLREQQASGAVTNYDVMHAQRLLDTARNALGNVSFRHEAEMIVEKLSADLAAIPTVHGRAALMASQWRETHRDALSRISAGLVDLRNASIGLQLASSALAGSELDALSSSFPADMDTGDRIVVVTEMHRQIAQSMDGLRRLHEACVWADNAASVMSTLPSPVTHAHLAALRALLEGFDALDAPTQPLIAQTDIHEIRLLLQAAQTDAYPQGSETNRPSDQDEMHLPAHAERTEDVAPAGKPGFPQASDSRIHNGVSNDPTSLDKQSKTTMPQNTLEEPNRGSAPKAPLAQADNKSGHISDARDEWWLLRIIAVILSVGLAVAITAEIVFKKRRSDNATGR